MGSLFTFLVVAAVVTWWFRRRAEGDASPDDVPGGSYRFRIRFHAGRVQDVEGRISRTTLSAFEDIAAHADLSGEVRLVGLTELQFSEGIPPFARQQLRNALVTSLAVH